MNPEDTRRIVEAECLVLKALAVGTVEGSARPIARRLLAGYHWCEPVHEAIYDVVMSLPSDNAELIREQLPARLTRRGFPDFDFTQFFQASTLSQEEVERFIRQLL